MERGHVVYIVSCLFALVLTGVIGDCTEEYNAITIAKNNYQACLEMSCVKPRNCAEIQAQGHNTSGLYAVYYKEGEVWTPVRVYCDMETAGGGWLVFQRRQDGTEDFYRNWADYTNGFGDPNNEFWLGNYHVHMLTSSGQYKLRFDLEDFEGEKRYAEYSSFSIGSPSNLFKLAVSGYSGDATDNFLVHNGFNFSTKDQDHDTWPGACAISFKGAWWYLNCHDSNLNGLYLGGPHTSYADGIEWDKWHGDYYSLKFTEMKIKPN